MDRSMNAPGSPSSALQITYFFSLFEASASSHFLAAGNPPPPLPRRPDFIISEITSSGLMASDRARPWKPPCVR
jgi:hypothetical protein